MPDRLSLNPHNVQGIDLFPDISEELDRRIVHSEQRIKFWIMAGVAVNLLVAISAALPTVFYMGQVSRDILQTQQQVNLHAAELQQRRVWTQERMVWEARIEAELRQQGIEIDRSKVPGQGI